ncbi:anchored repeat ABC transporter, substrate-binding protein [Boudabousia tangfeifanii]|uniref:anchored repeat ABC transporter, substrate-binding protein n=1 Tax=Boudabousia tangfeifanii TaxID=1912795 RepID=UPI0009F44BA3|nr:anchored repeat ABC transporter, substrate-binding protein [Boudabousia tangfeifanii]
MRSIWRHWWLWAGLAAVICVALVLPQAFKSTASTQTATTDQNGVTASAGVSAPESSEQSTAKRPQVVTSTAILADIARNVAGNRADVTALVPPGADPHSYEPTLHTIRSVVYADAAFTNYMMLEEHSLIKAIDTNLRPGVPNVALAEDATRHFAEVIPLIEDASLDTVWLGLRARGEAKDRSSELTMRARAVRGPGQLAGFLTGAFGQPEIYFQGSEKNPPATGENSPSAHLPIGAHTHVSWAFDQPGIYQLDLVATQKAGKGFTQSEVGQATITFAVGVDPSSDPRTKDRQIVDAGHVDITADTNTKKITLFTDPKGGGEYTQKDLDPNQIVIVVPPKALQLIPAGSQYRFLGHAGAQVYLLAQAVLGKHVHGEIDPHLWHDVKNVKAFALSIRDTMMQVDPAGASQYARNTEEYIRRLDGVDKYVRAQIDQIPRERRTLVTTHDAYGYLAHAYGLKVAGFVSPNPGQEPSVADRIRLARTMRDLGVQAVFLEPYLATRNTELTQVAADAGAKVCPLYSDTLDNQVPTYIDLMRFNADSLRKCLGGK